MSKILFEVEKARISKLESLGFVYNVFDSTELKSKHCKARQSFPGASCGK